MKIRKRLLLFFVAFGLISTSVSALELKGQSTANMDTNEEISNFVASLSPSELIQAINALEVKKEDCSLNLIGYLRHQLVTFFVEGKLTGKRSSFSQKLSQQKEKCQRERLLHGLKNKNSKNIWH